MSSECCVIISDIEKHLEHDRMPSDTNSDRYEDMQQIRTRFKWNMNMERTINMTFY